MGATENSVKYASAAPSRETPSEDQSSYARDSSDAI
jgi:hypothetical protein